MCSGVCPGVCMTVAVTLPSSRTSPSLTPLEREIGLRAFEEHVFRAGSLGERAARREVVGMDMGVDDEEDPHAGRSRRLEVGLDVADRINDRADALPPQPKR